MKDPELWASVASAQAENTEVVTLSEVDISDLEFHDLFDIEEIQRMQDAFSAAMGVASVIAKTDGTPITRMSNFTRVCRLIRNTKKGGARCRHSDKVIGQRNPTGPVFATCLSGGLLDGGAPISVGGRPIANWLIGQVMEADTDERHLRNYGRELGLDEAELMQALANIPRMSKEQFGKICETLYLLGAQLSNLALKNWQQRQYINELQRTGAALRETEERYRTLMQQSSEAIVLVDPDTRRVIETNRNFQELLGYSPVEMKDMHVYDFVADSKESIDCYYDEALTIRHELSAEVRPFLHKNGRVVEVERSGAMVHLQGKTVYMITARDVTERRRTEEKMRYLSFHDTLTKLYNRSYFEEELRRVDNRREGSVGLIVFDLDGLKLVNDSFGHEQGDNLLVRAAELIRSCFREEDIVARIGGDEFVVLMHDTTADSMEAAIVRINAEVSRSEETAHLIPLSLSVGHAFGGARCAATRDLFREADNNMYRGKLHRSQSTRSAIVQTVMSLLEARDFITEGHAERLPDMVTRLARVVGLPESRMNDLRLLAQFHDIGKVGIPDRILLKPGALLPDEMVEMQRHCEIGHRIAQSSPDLLPVADWVLKHQEWWNGQGYPLRLSGEQIPAECRILAIVDAYDAMTSDRPYRNAMGHDAAISELRRCSGTQFDPSLVEHFLAS